MHRQDNQDSAHAPSPIDTIAVIGCGKMGGAIAAGLLASARGPRVVLFDTHSPLADAIAATAPDRAHIAASAAQALALAQAVVLAVKPADIWAVLQEAQSLADSRLLVSVAAGLQAPALRQAAGTQHRVVRVMPNTPSLIGEGCATVLADVAVRAQDAAAVASLFEPLGQVVTIDKEPLMDAATGLAGSGPAFVALFVEALADAAVAEGLPRPVALKMAAQTVRGAASLMLRQHPAEVKDGVGSPGGTTMAGVCAAEAHGLRAAAIAAVRAAAARSRDMR
jgi:pyrroline-5-carboxylate reductase